MTVEVPLLKILLFIAGTITACLVLALSATVYFYNRKSRINRTFAIYALLASIWMGLGVFNIFIPLWDARIALVQMMFSSFLGAIFFLFGKAIADGNTAFKKHHALWFLPPLFIVIYSSFVLLTPEMLAGFKPVLVIEGLKLYRRPDLLYWAHSLFVLLGHAAGGVMILRANRKENNLLYKRRNNIILLALFIGTGGCFATYNLFVLAGRPAPILLFLPLLTAAMIITGYSLLATKAWRLEHLVEIIKTDEKLLKKQINEITQISRTDPLTRIYNRNMLYDELDRAISRALRYNAPFSIIMIDIDYFKEVNDAFGHVTGDEVLVELTGLVQSLLRKNDLFARWGGEEFIVLAPHTMIRGAKDLAEKIRVNVSRHRFATIGRLSCSFGVCQFDTTCTRNELIKRADKALFRAKTKGRNRICIHWGESRYMTAESDDQYAACDKKETMTG